MGVFLRLKMKEEKDFSLMLIGGYEAPDREEPSRGLAFEGRKPVLLHSQIV